MLLGGQEPVTQRTVVGEEEEPFRILVQPPHREKPHPSQMGGQQIQHRGLLGVLGGREHPAGLVEHQVAIPLPVHGLAIHPQLHRFPVEFILWTRHHGAIRRHPPGLHQVLHLPPGPASGAGEDLIQPFQCHLLYPPLPWS